MDVQEHPSWLLMRERTESDRPGRSIDRAIYCPRRRRAAQLSASLRGYPRLDRQRRRVGIPPRNRRDERRGFVPKLWSQRLEFLVPERHGRGAYVGFGSTVLSHDERPDALPSRHSAWVTAIQVLWLLALFEKAGIDVWIDGGWGVDALLGRQTRPHADLDLVVANDSVAALRSLLEQHGFEVVRDWQPTALALRHSDGREVDLHPVEPTPDGGGDQVQLDGVGRWYYEPPVSGTINGVGVRCCSLSTQLRAHVGYEPDDNDRADMQALNEEFGVTLPPPYDRST